MTEHVAPLVGAWIEIPLRQSLALSLRVAPLVGAWIEISEGISPTINTNVAPLVGAWIEITFICKHSSLHFCRSSCRGVD